LLTLLITGVECGAQMLQWLETLRSAGVAPEDIDVVLCTHLHVDHVGWNTRLENGRWVPTFPNARYLIAGIRFTR